MCDFGGELDRLKPWRFEMGSEKASKDALADELTECRSMDCRQARMRSAGPLAGGSCADRRLVLVAREGERGMTIFEKPDVMSQFSL